MVGSSLGAEVVRTLHTDGIEWRFDIPLASLDPNRQPAGRENADRDDDEEAPPARPAA